MEKIPTIEKLIDRLKLVDWNDPNVPNDVHNLLARYSSDDWRNFIPGEVTEYRRDTVKQETHFLVLLLTFPPNTGNKIHNHGVSECCFKVLQGNILERHYRNPACKCEMKCKGDRLYQTNELNETSNYNIHCCCNPSEEQTAVTLVVYFPPLSKFQVFDQNTGETKDLIFTPEAPTIHGDVQDDDAVLQHIFE
nr:cysteine dioxygenase type 1-like; partial [Biomphalaria glabrata]